MADETNDVLELALAQIDEIARDHRRQMQQAEDYRAFLVERELNALDPKHAAMLRGLEGPAIQ